MSTTEPRILISRPDHLGDVLLTLPAVHVLRRRCPDAHITFVTTPSSVEVPRHCPDVDQATAVPFPPIAEMDSKVVWSERVEHYAAALRGEYDIAILPRIDDSWSGSLALAAEIPVRLGYDHHRTRPFLTNALPHRRTHVSWLAFELAQAAGDLLGAAPDDIRPRAKHPYFVPSRADEIEADQVQRGISPLAGDAPIILLPGSGWKLKNWPARHWGNLAAGMHARYGVSPVILGRREESELIDSVVSASGGAALGLAGALSLGGLAALFRHARLVVACDNGPLHLAAMIGAPVLALFGPADPVEFRPLTSADRCRIVRVSLPCSPCRLLLHPPCGAVVNPACMTGISVQMVGEEVEEMLAGIVA